MWMQRYSKQSMLNNIFKNLSFFFFLLTEFLLLHCALASFVSFFAYDGRTFPAAWLFCGKRERKGREMAAFAGQTERDRQ